MGTTLKIFARLRVEGSNPTPLHLGLFDNGPGLKDPQAGGVSPRSDDILKGTHKGVYFDGSCGVSLAYSGVWPVSHGGGVALIPSCYDDTDCQYVLDIYTNAPVGMRWQEQ